MSFYTVLDEADRMLDSGFFPDIEFILQYIPKRRQIILLSATWSGEIDTVVRANMNCSEIYQVAIGDPYNQVNKDIVQLPLVVGNFQKRYLLGQLISKLYCGYKILVFFNRREELNQMVDYFQTEKLAPVYAFSSDVDQLKRETLIKYFIAGTIRIIFSTDAGSRGLGKFLKFLFYLIFLTDSFIINRYSGYSSCDKL